MNLRYTVLLLCAVAIPCSAETFRYVDWTSAAPSLGTASGSISLPDGSTVDVGFEVLNSDGSAGTFFFGQTDGGTNYWSPADPYISDAVENPPPDADILSLVGGQNQTYKITLSEPIKDPIMAIVSLGRPGTSVTYDFDRPFSIVSQGRGFWGGGDAALSQLDGDQLQGAEGHGTIRFDGVFDSFSWTVPETETWHGFTYGIRTTEALEPTTPEPSGLGLAGIGLLGLAAARRRR